METMKSAAMIDTAARADETARAETPIESTIARIDKAIMKHGDVIQALGARLEPAMHAVGPEKVPGEVPDGYGASSLARTLTDFAERIESITSVVGEYQARLEV